MGQVGHTKIETEMGLGPIQRVLAEQLMAKKKNRAVFFGVAGLEPGHPSAMAIPPQFLGAGWHRGCSWVGD